MNIGISARMTYVAFVVSIAVYVSVDAWADKPSTVRTRHVELEGQPNFRDVGGYRTSDGKTVKKGLVYRSGHLAELTKEDVEKIEQLGIAKVFNFLTDKEIKAAGEDRLPQGSREVSLPIDSDMGLAQQILVARQKADFSKLPPDLNLQIHRMLINDAKREYATLMKRIADAEEPIVFHCSHGIHRTGTAAAILLWGLGVPWETVRRDYLLSNKYRKDEIEKRLLQLRDMAARNQRIPADQVNMTNFRAFYVLQGSYIDAMRDEINEKYGSIKGYLTTELKLTDQDLRALRKRLLQEEG